MCVVEPDHRSASGESDVCRTSREEQLEVLWAETGLQATPTMCRVPAFIGGGGGLMTNDDIFSHTVKNMHTA